MIYTSARWADAAHTQVIGTDAEGRSETVAADFVLFRQPDDGPAGFVANGGVIAPYVEPPAPEATPQTITKRQLVAALIVGAGVTDPDGFIEGAIATITDPTQRALALNDWRNAPYYVRTHPLFNDPDMLAAISLDAAQIDGLWALAVTMPK